MVLIKEDPVALAILKVMEKVKPERRLYPDLYALEVAEAARLVMENEKIQATKEEVS